MSDGKKARGFLEELYLEGLDSERFESLSFEGEDDGAASVIEQYRVLIKDYPPDRLEKSGTVPAELLEGLKRIGFFGLNIPQRYGGLGLGVPAYLKVLEAVARTDMALAIIPTAHLSIGLKGIILFGTDEQKSRYLSPAAGGDMIFAYALTEPGTGSDARHIETRAELSGDGSHYLLNGRKTYITNANYAGGLTVFAQLDPEQPGFMGAFIVETAWEGVKISADMPKMGLKISSTASIAFTDVRVPAENLLGRRGDGFRIAMTILNYGRLGLGAASVGAMKQSVDDMKRRSSSRKQFGVPIGDFPLVQEKVVQAKVHAYVAEAMTAMTSRLLEGNPLANLAVESSHTKLYGTTRAWDTLYDALQVAGGSGYLSTQPYEKRMRDFRVTTVFEGTTEIHSIYPALFLLRALAKRVEAEGKGGLSRFFHLVKGMLRRHPWPLSYGDPIMKRAGRQARRNAKAVRGMLHLTLLLYGRKAVRREFLLRRITRLSLSVYGLLAALALLGEAGDRGGKVKKELQLLSYFLEETKETERRDRRLFDSRRERVNRAVWRDLDG